MNSDCQTSFSEVVWQLKHPEKGSNAETLVNLYRHLPSLMNILTFSFCERQVERKITWQQYIFADRRYFVINASVTQSHHALSYYFLIIG